MQGVINCPPSSGPLTEGPIGNKEGPVEEGGLLRPSSSSHKSYQGASFGPNCIRRREFHLNWHVEKSLPKVCA